MKIFYYIGALVAALLSIMADKAEDVGPTAGAIYWVSMAVLFVAAELSERNEN